MGKYSILARQTAQHSTSLSLSLTIQYMYQWRQVKIVYIWRQVKTILPESFRRCIRSLNTRHWLYPTSLNGHEWLLHVHGGPFFATRDAVLSTCTYNMYLAAFQFRRVDQKNEVEKDKSSLGLYMLMQGTRQADNGQQCIGRLSPFIHHEWLAWIFGPHELTRSVHQF